MQSCLVNEETVDPRELRNALGRFATGVTVITTQTPSGKLEGLTANSFSALSLDPPLVLWSIRLSAPSLPGFRAASGFAVNVLAADQRMLAAAFATASIDKFADVPFAIGLRGYPVLPGSIAVFECQTENTVEGGDHVIFIGRVVAASYCDGEPLVFSCGEYCVPRAPHPAAGAAAPALLRRRVPGDDQMKLGFFTMPVHPVGRKLSETLQEDREMTILADKLGFVEGFIGEHVTDAAETITSSLIFVAWLLNETKQIRLGSGTVNMPNHHPARVAGEVAMIDHMSNGRFIFGISPGGLLSDAEVFGNLDKDRTAMFVEAIDHVLAIWSGEPPYNLKGEHWTISTERTLIAELGQGFMAKPYQRPHPPIVVTAVAPFSKGVTEAAARGWEPISANFLLPKWVKSHWPKYVEGCEQAGRPAEPKNWRVAKSIFVADDLATAKRYATSPEGPYYGYYKSLATKLVRSGRANLFKADQTAPDSTVTPQSVVDQVVIWGTPDKVVDDLLAFRDEIGDFGTLLYASHDWADKRLGRRSMELMTEKVMPAIQRHTAAASEAA